MNLPNSITGQLDCLWKTLYQPEDVTELRIPRTKRDGTASGYFDKSDAMAASVKIWDGLANIYFCLNPVNPALLARAANRMQSRADKLTGDADVHRLRWLLIDLDAERPAGISATNDEHTDALASTEEVRAFLLVRYQLATVYADSGNGGHLLLPLDLPNEPANRELLKSVLAGLAFRFNGNGVHVDRTTFNPSRITKMYGTLAVKGDSTDDRPHRRSAVIDIPDALPPASVTTLQQIADLLPLPQMQQAGTQSPVAFDLRGYMDRHSLSVHAESSYEGGTRFQLAACPFNPEHAAKDAAVFLMADGKIGFKCLHDSCQNKQWQDVREHFEPGFKADRDRRQHEFANRSGNERNEFNERSPSLVVSAAATSLNSFNSSAQPPEKIDEAAYYGLAGAFVRLVEPHTESDPVALLVQFLTAFGNVIGRSAYFPVESSRHYMNEFAVIVGRSAKARKGTSLQNVLNVFGGVNRDWFDNRVKSGLSSGEGMIHAVRDALEVEEDIKEKGGKVTGRQTVLKDAGESDKRLLAIESEFARCLRVMEREGSTLSSILRDAWDNGKLSVLTKTPQKATEAHISVIGHITRDELCRLLTDTEAGNGFANRIIWIYSERSKLLPDGGNLPAEDFADLQQRLQNTIHFAGSVQRMHRDAAAKAMWHSVYPELTRDVPGLLGAVTSRAEAHTLRLSCIYALLDGSTAVRPEHMEAALAIWDYAEKSAAYIFGNALGDPVADEILRALQNNPAGMTRTELHKLFGNNAKSGSMQQALHTLAEQQRIKCASRPGENGGRPTELWLATTEETK